MILNLKSPAHSPTETLCYSRRYERCDSPEVSLAMCACNSEHARVILMRLVQSTGHTEGGLVDKSKNIRGASSHYLENSGVTRSPHAPKLCCVHRQHRHHWVLSEMQNPRPSAALLDPSLHLSKDPGGAHAHCS